MFGNQNIMLIEKTKNQSTKEKILLATINAKIPILCAILQWMWEFRNPQFLSILNAKNL